MAQDCPKRAPAGVWGSPRRPPDGPKNTQQWPQMSKRARRRPYESPRWTQEIAGGLCEDPKVGRRPHERPTKEKAVLGLPGLGANHATHPESAQERPEGSETRDSGPVKECVRDSTQRTRRDLRTLHSVSTARYVYVCGYGYGCGCECVCVCVCILWPSPY